MPAAASRTRRHPSRRAAGVAHLGVVRRRPPLLQPNRIFSVHSVKTLLPQQTHHCGTASMRRSSERFSFGRSEALQFTHGFVDCSLRAKSCPQRRRGAGEQLAMDRSSVMNALAATSASQRSLRSRRTCRARLPHVPRNGAWPAAPKRQQSSDAATSGAVLHSFPPSCVSPNQAVELTPSARHARCCLADSAAPVTPRSEGSSPWGR